MIGEKSFYVSDGNGRKDWSIYGDQYIHFGSEIKLVMDLGESTVAFFVVQAKVRWNYSWINRSYADYKQLIQYSDNSIDWTDQVETCDYGNGYCKSESRKARFWKMSGRKYWDEEYAITDIYMRGPTEKVAPYGKIKLHLGKTPNGQVVVPIKAYGAGADVTAELKVNVKPVNHPPVLDIGPVSHDIFRASDNTATYRFNYSDPDGDPVTFDIKQVSGTSKVVPTTDVATKTVTLSFSDIKCPWPIACSLDISGSDGKVGGVSNDFRLYIADPAAGVIPVTP